MTQPLKLLALVGVATLAACGSKTDPTEKNFATAMTAYFEKKGDLCLTLRSWPVDISDMDQRQASSLPTGRAGQMAALASAGLVQAEDAETNGLFGGKVNVRRYNLADAAKPYIKERAVQTIGNGTVKQADLCWGKKTLDKIVKWEGPMKLGDYQEAGITYTYQVNGVADWARKPEVLAAFPEIKSVLDGAGNRESKHVVKLTSQGWEARGLD